MSNESTSDLLSNFCQIFRQDQYLSSLTKGPSVGVRAPFVMLTFDKRFDESLAVWTNKNKGFYTFIIYQYIITISLFLVFLDPLYVRVRA